MDTPRSEVPSNRREYLTSTAMWNSFGVVDAIVAFGVVYAVMQAVRAMGRRFRPIRNRDQS